MWKLNECKHQDNPYADRDAVSTFKPSQGSRPESTADMFKVQEGDLASHINKLKSTDNSQRPLSTFAHREKYGGNVGFCKPNVADKVDNRERPLLPTRTDSISDQNLKQFKLKKTGIDLTKKAEASPSNGDAINCEPPKKPIGKINKSLFEELESTVSPSKVKAQSLQRNSLPNSKPAITSPRPVVSQKPQNTRITNNYPPPPDNLLEDDDIYDTVENTVSIEIIANPETEEIYDDVQVEPSPPHPIIKPKPKPSPKPSSAISAPIQDEIYDDVDPSIVIPNDPSPKPLISAKPALPSVTNSTDSVPIEDEIYDDIDPSIEVQEIYDDVVAETEEVYDDIVPTVESNTNYPARSSVHSLPPQTSICDKSNDYLKPTESETPAKTFTQLESYRFAVPVGLADWMREIISSNKCKLQELGMTAYLPITQTTYSLKPRDEDTASINSTDSKGKPDKENKKERKRKEKEKKAKEQQMKKDLKVFGVDINKERTVLGSVVASSERKGTKKDLAFTHGDEINILKTSHECPADKCLAQNMNTSRIGYIVKEEFNLGNMDDMEPMPRTRVSSIIPTIGSDEEDDTFSKPVHIAPRPAGAPQLPVIPQPGWRTSAPLPPLIPISAPPVPDTARPVLNPILVSDEVYDDIAAVPPDDMGEIYEDIGDGLSKSVEMIQEDIYDDIKN